MISEVNIEPGLGRDEVSRLIIDVWGPAAEQAKDIASVIAAADLRMTYIDTTGIGLPFAERIQDEINTLIGSRVSDLDDWSYVIPHNNRTQVPA